MKSTRDAFGEALVELGRKNPKVVVVSGDLEDSTRAEYFKKEFPERFFNLGIAEHDMVGTAVGLSRDGLIPFACSFAAFLIGNAYGLIRIAVCYNNSNVKLIGAHSGLTVGEDGATAQCLEDFAGLNVLPNMLILSPADALEARKATFAMAQVCGPAYMRLGRTPCPMITEGDTPFEIGKANIMRDGRDLTIIATGIMVSEALNAAKALEKERISCRVLNMHTIKPVDKEAIIAAAKQTGAIVTAEEHQLNGGLGSIVAEAVCLNHPVPMEMVAVRDAFGESGDAEGLLKKYHLKDLDIIAAAKRVFLRK